MSADDFRAIVGRLRSWGFDVSEVAGCYSRSNGLGWARGVPCGHIDHHFVCSMNPAQSYINSIVSMLVNGSTVNWFADVNGRAYLIGAGPMNHSGQGNTAVLNRTVADQAPTGPATAAGDMTGNTWYSGTETQHPGDSTPYPQPLIDVTVAIGAAEAIQFGWTANRIIHHFEWTGRKVDMSLWGGRASTEAGTRMRAAVAARMGATSKPGNNTDTSIEGEAEMNDQEWARMEQLIDKRINIHFGAEAVNNPEAALNAGVMKRIDVNLRTELDKRGI